MSWALLLLSFQVATIATAAAPIAGVALATLLATRRFPGRDLIDVLVTAPMVLPPTVLGYCVLVAVGRRSAVGQMFEQLTGSPIVFTRTGAIVAASIGSLPLIVKGQGPRCRGSTRRYCGRLYARRRLDGDAPCAARPVTFLRARYRAMEGTHGWGQRPA